MPIITEGQSSKIDVFNLSPEDIRRLTGSGKIRQAMVALKEIDPALCMLLMDGIHHQHHRMHNQKVGSIFNKIQDELEEVFNTKYTEQEE